MILYEYYVDVLACYRYDRKPWTVELEDEMMGYGIDVHF